MTNRCSRIYVGTGPSTACTGPRPRRTGRPRNQVPGVYQITKCGTLLSVIGWPGEGCTPEVLRGRTAVQRESGS